MVPEFDDARFEDLIARARAGSKDVIEKILVESVPKIEIWNRNWYRFMIRKRLSGRDLTQEVLLLASYSFEQFRGTNLDQWYGWLFQIHRSVVSNLAKHDGRLVFVEPPATPDGDFGFLDGPSNQLTPGSHVSLNEEIERVRRVLQRLLPQYRAVLVGWMDGMSLEVQANSLNLTVSQIRTLRLNALREFSSLWKNFRESA